MSSSFADGSFVIERYSEADIVRCLSDASLGQRDDALAKLRLSLHVASSSDAGRDRCPFLDPPSVFDAIAVALTDDAWDTRYQTVKLVGDLIPLFEPDDQLDRCIEVHTRTVHCRPTRLDGLHDYDSISIRLLFDRPTANRRSTLRL